MHIATETPSVITIKNYVILEVQSGPETIRIALTPYDANHAGHHLRQKAQAIIDDCRATAEVVPFTGKRKAIA